MLLIVSQVGGGPQLNLERTPIFSQCTNNSYQLVQVSFSSLAAPANYNPFQSL